MNNLIITTRQSPVRLLVDYVATTILWTLFALFIFLFAMDLLTGYYWQSEARSRLQFYFLLAVANAVVLIVWALYNKLRFQKQQHHAAYQYTPQEYAESLAIPDELYQQLQKSHRMSVHFGFAPIFPDTCYHLTHYWPAAADIPVASDNPVHYAGAIRYNARTPLQGSLLPLTRLV